LSSARKELLLRNEQREWINCIRGNKCDATTRILILQIYGTLTGFSRICDLAAILAVE
jgi:hypothetical protein